MTKVIDFTTQLLKRRKTVKVKVENKREHLLVKIEGVNTTENRASSPCNTQEIGSTSKATGGSLDLTVIGQKAGPMSEALIFVQQPHWFVTEVFRPAIYGALVGICINLIMKWV